MNLMQGKKRGTWSWRWEVQWKEGKIKIEKTTDKNEQRYTDGEVRHGERSTSRYIILKLRKTKEKDIRHKAVREHYTQ